MLVLLAEVFNKLLKVSQSALQMSTAIQCGTIHVDPIGISRDSYLQALNTAVLGTRKMYKSMCSTETKDSCTRLVKNCYKK